MWLDFCVPNGIFRSCVVTEYYITGNQMEEWIANGQSSARWTDGMRLDNLFNLSLPIFTSLPFIYFDR